MSLTECEADFKVNDLAGRIRFMLIGLLDQNPARFGHLAPALEKAKADLLQNYGRTERSRNGGAGGVQ